MAIDFPSSPATGQIFTSGDVSWVWTGTVWNIIDNGPVIYKHAANHGVSGSDAVTIAPSQVTGTAIINGDVHLITFCTSATRPSSPTEGQVIYETDTNKYYGWNGTIWSGIGGGAAYQTTAPSDPQTGDLWVDSDATADTLNVNDFKLKSDAILDSDYSLLWATMGVM